MYYFSVAEQVHLSYNIHFAMNAKALLIVFAATLLLASSVRAQRQYEMLDETFSTKDKPGLKLVVSDADVEVVSGANGEVRVQILVEAQNEARGRRYFQAQHFDVALRDGEVHVLSQPEQGVRGHLRDQPETRIILTTPRSVNLRLRTSDGDIQIGDVNGDVFVRTADGDIGIGMITGTMFEARTSDGDIIVDSAEFKNVVVHTSDGDIGVGQAAAEEITAHTSDGDIHFDHLTGIADIRTADGDVHAGALVSTSSKVQTSDGDISLENVVGDLTALSADGDLAIDLMQPGTVILKTTDGDVMVRVPEDHAASVTLAGSTIQMDCCSSFEGHREERRVEGHVNGGGARLEVTTSDGTVYLQKR